MLVLASLLRFGFIANFISEPVLTGFKSGIGLVIVVDQLPKLLGIHVVKGTFVHNVITIILETARVWRNRRRRAGAAYHWNARCDWFSGRAS